MRSLNGRTVCHIYLWAMAFCMLLACALGSAPDLRAAEAPIHVRSAEAPPLARAQGAAETAVVNWVLANSGPLTGDHLIPDYRVAYTITPSEGWWEMAGGGKLAWHEPPADSVHLRVFVLDASDGRLVNGLTVTAMLIDANGNEHPAPLAFGWYPLINAYGGNVALEADGSYRLRLTIVAPLPRSTPPAPGEMNAETPARIFTLEFHPINIQQKDLMQAPRATVTSVASEAKLLKPCNLALGAALTALWKQSAAGAEQPNGDYFVAFAAGDESMAGALSKLRLGGRESTPLEVLVRDSRTGRPIPNLTLHGELISAAGTPLNVGELSPVHRPLLNVYARSARLTRKGPYRLRIWFDPPTFRRWGRQSERFAQAGEVEFEGVSLPLTVDEY